MSDFLVSSQESISEPDGVEGEENMSPWALVWSMKFNFSLTTQGLTSAQHTFAKTCEYYQTTTEAASE